MPGCDGFDAQELAPLHAWNDFLETDVGGAEHSPTEFHVLVGNHKSPTGLLHPQLHEKVSS
jgi:hypothetical protein